MKVIKYDESGSVLIQSNDLKVWIDVWEDKHGDIQCDWNQYIFMLDDPKDLEIRAFQSNYDNILEAFYLATDYYIRKTINKEID